MSIHIKNFFSSIGFIHIFKFFLIIFVISIPFKNAVYQVSLVIIIFMSFLHVYLNNNYYKIKVLYKEYKDIFYLFIFLILFLSISNILNMNLENNSFRALVSFIYKFGLLFYALFYFYLVGYFKEKEIISYVLFSILLQFFLGVHQAVFDYNVLENIKNISMGISGATFNRNQFGFIMGIGVLISLFYFKNKFIRLLIPLFILGAIFSYSRAVWIALSFAIFLYVIIDIRKITLKNMLYSVLVIIVVLSVAFSIDSVSVRFEQLLNGNSSGRSELWVYTIELVKEKILFGYGLDSWNLYKLKHYSNIHNSILEILFVMGITGLVIFISIFIVTLKEIFSTKNYIFLSILSYFSIISLFGNSVFYSKIFLSFLIVFCMLMYKNRVDNRIINKEQK